MIVSARIFLILLVPLLLHGAPTPHGHDLLSHGGNPPSPPSNVNFPSYNADPVQPATANYPPHQPLGLDPLVEGKYVFKDFTAHFAVLEPGEPCNLPADTRYRIKSNSKEHSFKEAEAGKSIPIRVPTIAFTKGLLVLLTPGAKVTISNSPDSEIQVPNEISSDKVTFWKADKKTILVEVGYVPVARVVNVPPMEQDDFWLKCLHVYGKKGHEILELNSEMGIEAKEKYMCRCFHNNIWNIGRGFIPFDVNQHPPDPEGTRKRKRPPSPQSPRCREHSEGVGCGS